jgi:hypothetical protein
MGDSMRALSVSAAWEETRAILVRDGRLYISVALALIALPSAISVLVNPGGLNSSTAPVWKDLIALFASLIALAGQLALIRLALGPSTTVGTAVVHGLRRMPFYVAAVVLLVIALVILMIPLVVILMAAGIPIASSAVRVPASPVTVLVGLLYFAVAAFFGVRMILSAAIASAEDAGPIGILRRSWALTAGHWWALFGFVAIFLVGVIIVLLALGSALGVVVRLTLGAVEPMSAAALVLALVQSLVSAAISTLFALMLARIYLQLAGRDDAEVFR